MMKKFVLISIILFILLTSLLIVKTQANNERIDISGKIVYGDNRSFSMTPGETRTILIQIKNTGSSAAHFAVQILGDGEYLYFNIEQERICNPYYGQTISLEEITLDPGESEWIRGLVFARKSSSKSIPITIALYGAKPGTNIFLLDTVSSDVHISNSPLQDTLSYDAILSILCIIFVAYIVIKTHRGGFDAKDAYLLLLLFFISILFRAFCIENLSLTGGEEGGYIHRSKIILTNNWILPKQFILGAPPIFPYLVTAILYLFGDNIGVLRIISIISGALTVCLVYIIGKSLFDRRAGLIAAFFLCFCNFHILYSRQVMTDSLSIFFVFSALYLFWKGYCEDRGDIYFYFAGFVLGFGTVIKYSSYVMIPVVILYVLWTKKSIKALFDRRLIILFTVAFLTIIPYLFYLHVNDADPFYWNLVTRFIYGEADVKILQGGLSLSSLLRFVHKALFSYNIVLTNGDYMIPWSTVFKLVSLLLFPITLLYHLYLSLKKHPNSSLLVIYFGAMAFFIAFFSAKHRYYLLYLLPAYFLLLSSLIVDCVDYLKLRLSSIKSHLAPIAVFILVLTAVFGISYVIIGPMTPIIEKGEYYPIESSVLKVKDHLASDGSVVLVGTIFYHGAGGGGVAHYLTSDLCELYHIDARLIPLFLKREKPVDDQWYGVDIEMLKRLKPRFIIADKFIVDSLTTTDEKKYFYENYCMLPPSRADIPNPNAFQIVVYERKDCDLS
jgi:4-amino-4-deoxy-L-arabinose transferase-like glycosyltransferase